MQFRSLILVFAGLPAAASLAQAPAQGTAQVSVARANFRATCSLDADVMATLLEGAEVEVLASEGDWYRVRHLATGIEGCLHHTVLGSVAVSEVEAEDDLREAEAREAAEREAAAREAAEREAAARAAELEAQRERREAELAAREAEGEQMAREADRATPGSKRLTGYLDFNIGYTAPAVDRLTYSGPVTQGSPPRVVPGSRADSDYQYDRDLTFGVAGGFLRALAAGGGIGAGVSHTRATYAVDLDLQVSRPHSMLPMAIVADGIATPGPDREETAVHLHVVYAPPTAEQWRIRLFLGPSLFRSELPLWSVVVSRFPVNPPRMEIQRVEFSTQEETVVGGHVGADLAYFFSDVFGIGALGMFSRATGEVTIALPDPAESLAADFDLGGVSATLGLRLRF
ncbi:MAG: hypothetical protein ACRD2Z_01925 [Thermoanaerobaculia bacterium]